MIRLHLETEDLLNTHFRAQPAPLIELGLGIATMKSPSTPSASRRWQRRMSATYPGVARPLLELIPDDGTCPTFIDPPTVGFDEGREAVRASDQRLVVTELERVFRGRRPVAPWVRGLAARDAAAWAILDRAMLAAYNVIIFPNLERIAASCRADVALRSRRIAEEGLSAVLVDLCQGARWRGSTLKIDADRQVDVWAGGRGLTVVPSALWTGRPLVGESPDGSALLVYAAATPFPLIEDDPGEEPLSALIGRTRAAVLRLLLEQRTTGQIADALGISAATASEHAKRLRQAGLVVTERDGRAVWHACTPLGSRLLAG